MNFTNLDIKNQYRSNDCTNIGKTFFQKVLPHAVSYYRAVGFFSSSSLIYTSYGLTKIYEKYTKGSPPCIRYIVSPILSSQDIDAIKKGYKSKQKTIEDAMIKEFTSPKDEFESERLNMISHLISSGAMDIKVAVTSFSQSEIGMYHEKIGIILDQLGNKIAFSGSLNESENAFVNNFESILVFKSWTENFAYCSDISENFDKLWNDYTNNVEIFSFPEAVKRKLFKYKKESFDIDIDKNEYLRKKVKFTNEYKTNIEKINNTLYDYQKKAINNWYKHNCRGIFDMATGTGKTYTALGAIISLLNSTKGKLFTIIVCPYQHLVEQWVEEASKFDLNNFIIGYSNSKYTGYYSYLRESIKNYNDGLSNKIFFITTYDSYKSKNIQGIINNIKKPVLFVADEAHNVGTPSMINCLNNNFNYRLALSATIDRFRDDNGTKIIYEYFGEKCIEYSLERAIQEGKLSNYYYYPIVIYLNDEEKLQYIRISEKIARLFVIKNKSSSEEDVIKHLLIQRSKIISNAENKLSALENEIEKHLDETHILIYCGSTETKNDVNDQSSQIEKVCDLLGNKLHYKTAKYTSKESIEERQIIRSRFEDGTDLQVLVAIKCLDEGVNIPNIQTAYILASSTNPREYIQRRGRILRLAPDKTSAKLFDFICLPLESYKLKNYTSNQIKIFNGLIKNEIQRITEFSNSALNSRIGQELIENLKKDYEI